LTNCAEPKPHAVWCAVPISTAGPGFPPPENAVWGWSGCNPRSDKQDPEVMCRQFYGDKWTGQFSEIQNGVRPTGGNCRYDSTSVWCTVKKPGDGGPRSSCIPVCGSKGESVKVVQVNDVINTCLGPASNQCCEF